MVQYQIWGVVKTDNQFYPTPAVLADRMMRKIDFSGVSYILEPSVGNGDLLKAVARNAGVYAYGKFHPRDDFSIDVCEIDQNLRELADRKWYVVAEDFLEYSTFTRYDLIVMNPPFKDGDKHLLHALSLLRGGGQCACILNAETLRNAYTVTRRELVRKLEELGADVEFIEGAFKQAERKADVDIALVYIKLPQQEEQEDVLAGLAKAAGVTVTDGKVYDLTSSDPFQALVQRYQFDAITGLNMIADFKRINKYLSDPDAETIPHLKKLNERILSFGVCSNETAKMSEENKYLRALRGKYWSALFEMPELLDLMTNRVRQRYSTEINRFKAIDFTMSNIKRLQRRLAKASSESIEEAIVSVFDKLTYHSSLDKSDNVHYYSGWKTNSAFKMNGKIIIPVYDLFDRFFGSLDRCKLRNVLTDIEKILNYLDGGNTVGKSVQEILSDRFETNWNEGNKKEPYHDREKLHFKYFDVVCFKKGTVHLWFTDEKLLKRWNLFVGRKKNWLPSDYGRKDYSRMSQEEKSVVDSFEGKKEYQETIQNSGYYLNGVSIGMLTE